jgi:hypothetical protein
VPNKNKRAPRSNRDALKSRHRAVLLGEKAPDEAEELARLSAGIPAGIQPVNQGQLPKTLDERLKRIEKLAKHLRSEMAP